MPKNETIYTEYYTEGNRECILFSDTLCPRFYLVYPVRGMNNRIDHYIYDNGYTTTDFSSLDEALRHLMLV